RYLLPLATNTSLGQIVNARTLENQVSRLLTDEHGEIRHLGELLKKAAKDPAWTVEHPRFQWFMQELRLTNEPMWREAQAIFEREVKVSRRLVKYAEANAYQKATREALRQAAAELMKGAAIEAVPAVDLLDDEPLEIELATTLLYEHCHYPYRQIRRAVEG